MPKRKRSRAGNATIEFTLVGIPLVFVLISTIEMARGMWIYHTLAYAVKEGTRYAVGARAEQFGTNRRTYQSVCNAIAQAGTGLLPETSRLLYTPPRRHDATVHRRQLSRPAQQWPPGNNAGIIDNQPGQTISITGLLSLCVGDFDVLAGRGPGHDIQPLACQGSWHPLSSGIVTGCDAVLDETYDRV